MSKFAVLRVHHAISFVSVVSSMRAIINATPITGVHIAVSSVKMNLSYAVHGTSFYPHLAHLLKKVQGRASREAYVCGSALRHCHFLIIT